MMKRTNKALSLIFLFLFAASAPAPAQEYAGKFLDAKITLREDYSIVADGVELKNDVPPVEKDGVIFIPYRFAAEALKAEVHWNDAEKTVTLLKGGLKTVMRIGDRRVATRDGEIILASEPFIFESRAMIPLRAAAESLIIDVEEKTDGMYLASPDEAAILPRADEPAAAKPEAGKEPEGENIFAIFREQARKDRPTQTLKPFVIGAWIVALLLWLIKLAQAVSRKEDWRALALIGLFLAAGVPFAALANVMLSTWWAAIVIIGTSVAGLFSTEDYGDKLVTMGNTAQGLGLICTLFGLGLVVGPAIVAHNIATIGYGIYVKIEPTITGLTLSILMNILYGYDARKAKNQ